MILFIMKSRKRRNEQLYRLLRSYKLSSQQLAFRNLHATVANQKNEKILWRIQKSWKNLIIFRMFLFWQMLYQIQTGKNPINMMQFDTPVFIQNKH